MSRSLAASLLTSSSARLIHGTLDFDPAEARSVALMRHLPRKRPAFGGTMSVLELWDPRGRLLMPIAAETAKRINDVHLSGVDFSFYGYPTILDRFLETLKTLRPADEAKFVPAPEIGPVALEDYAFQTTLPSNAMAVVYPANPKFLEAEGKRVSGYIRGDQREKLANGQSALLCSSHPTIESAVGFAANQPIDAMIDMDEGGMFVFVFVRDSLVCIAYLPPPPAPSN